jgi:hypothetical protein
MSAPTSTRHRGANYFGDGSLKLSHLNHLIALGILARVVPVLYRLGASRDSLIDVIDSVGDSLASADVGYGRLGQRVFFDYPSILNDWYTNPEFTDRSGKPAVLPLRGEKRSFAALVRLVAPGAEPAEALTVLLKAKAVARIGRHRVRARSRVLNTAASNWLTAIRLLSVVDAMLKTIERNLVVGARDRATKGFYERSATNVKVDAKCIEDFHAFLREQGDEFLQTVDDWLSAHTSKTTAKGRSAKTVRVGTGIYMFASD